MNIEKEILMESGTNELEVLVFGIEKEKYGINIAKVREIIRLQELTLPPQAHPTIEGILNLREHIIPIISLYRALDYKARENDHSSRIIVTEFHKQWFGFIVDEVSNIYRISWSDIEPPTEHHKCTSLTGIAHVEDQLVLMLDVEKITQEIAPHIIDASDQELSEELASMRGSKNILIAEDSGMMRSLIHDTLSLGGYTSILTCNNGEEAWDALQGDASIDLVISDIEMPRIDGLRLTKLIKSDAELKETPVVIFSSIITEDNQKKGEAVGADFQIAKPDLDKLVTTLDSFLNISA
jgi:two-component system, chemotaxis family, chemotaxis protein CheV